MMTVEDARRQFPHTWTDMIYLNHAAISPMSFRVRNAVDAYLERRALKGIEPIPWAVTMLQDTKKIIAGLLGTTPDRIAFCLNTSEALSIVAEGYPWQSGDRILLYKYEFPTNVYPFLNQERKGVAVDFFDAPDGRITPEVVAANLRPETKMFSLSAVQFLTGYRADLEAIGKLCSARDIIFCVDSIQRFPYLPIDVERMHIDVLANGSHKWMMSPEGVSFLYINTKTQGKINQPAMGWTSVKNPFDPFNYSVDRLRDEASRYESGTMNFSGIAGLQASLKFFEEFGFAEMERRTMELSGLLIELLERYGAEVITPKHERGAIVTISFDDAKATFERLEKKNVIASLRAGKLRFAPYFYTTEEEVRKAVSILFE
jgi:selenocysteine lyase/cysteine desulfurase